MSLTHTGLLSLYNGRNLSHAESMLQSSARWSQDQLSQLIGLNNMGCYHWFKIQDRQQWRIKQFVSDKPMTSAATNTADDRSEYQHTAKEALEYWEECIAVANKTASSSSINASCGPSSSSTAAAPAENLVDSLANVGGIYWPIFLYADDIGAI
jgi:hypothetical protein